MILKAYEKFKEKFLPKKETTSLLSIPTTKKDRIDTNDKVKQIVKQDNYSNEDIETLKQYTGFGGLNMGDKDEYFTPKALAVAMVDIVDLKDNDIFLDPCTGGGIFPLVAKEKANINIIAVEPNPLSAKVSSAILGKNAKVTNSYFEDFKDNVRADAIITNVPFGHRTRELRGKDEEFKGITRTEDYIILKSLHSLKSKGMGVFITNGRLMNGKSKAQEAIMKQGEIIGAVRLPNAIFADAGADVVTDIVVIRKHDEIVNAIGKDEQRKLLIEPFDIANYFKDNPTHIIGDYTSKEEAIEKAIANGDKIHHLSQKDTVVTTLSNDEVFKKANETMKSFTPTINYGAMSIKEDIAMTKESVLDSNMTDLVERLKEFNEAFFRGKGIDFEKVRTFIDEYRALKTDKYNQSVSYFIQALKLYDLGVKDTLTVSKLIGLFYSTDEKVSNILTKEEWEKYKDILIKVAESKPSWSSENWVFDNTIRAYKSFNSTEDKSVQAKEIDIRKSIYDYTEKEIMDNSLMSVGGKVLTIEKARVEFDGMTEKQILSSLNEIVSEEKQGEYTKKIEEFISENTRIINPNNITVDLALASSVLAWRERREFASLILGLKSIEATYEKNVIENVKRNGYLDDYGARLDPIEIIKEMLGTSQGIVYNFIREIMTENKEPRFQAHYNISNETKEALAMVARTEFHNLQDIFTSILKNFIQENKEAKQQLEEYAKDKSIFVNAKTFGEDKLSEIEDLISTEWISNAHHYQNSDARKFSEREEGVIRYDTGLGKSLEAMLIGAKLIKKGKKVAYVVPNEIIGKMEAEMKKIFTSKMLEQSLVVTSQDKGSIANAIANKNYKFLLMTSSVLSSQFYLGDKVTSDLLGKDTKELNAGETNKYKISLRDYVSRSPKWDSKSSYRFEDLELDTMIIDEAHRFKNAVASASSGVKGLTTTPSNVALVMLYFVSYLKYVRRADGRGVILSTATPITSSPTEILSMLLFANNQKNMKAMGISNSKTFEETFFKIVKKDIIKTDGTVRNGKVLEGIKNLDILRNLGYRKVVKRTAEEESLVAEQNGKKINVKPSSSEIRIDVDDRYGENEEFGRRINKEYGRASKTLSQMEERGISEDEVLSVAVLREFGSMFSYLDKYKKSSISTATALGYTQIKLKEKISKEELNKAIGNVKVKHKIVETIDTPTGLEIKYKVGTAEIKNYDKTDFMVEKLKMFGSYCLPLLEEDGVTVNIPSIDYDVVKRVLNALKKSKVGVSFDKKQYIKLSSLSEKVLEQFVAFPKSKQIVYATTLSTHIIIENLIQGGTKDKIKFFHFNGSTVKNADKKMKMQEEFNDYNGKAVLIFGASGKVGVDFNSNVSSVHLLDVGLTPEDKEQAKGRAVRQGNTFNDVSVFNYYQNNTLDSFLEGIVGNKQEWIDSVEDTEVNSSSFNSDTLEAIARLAEKKYKHEDGTVEEKIKKYLAYMEDENKRKAKMLERTFTDQAVGSLLSMNEEKKEFVKSYGDTPEGAKEMAKVKIVSSYPSWRFFGRGSTQLTKSDLISHINKVANFIANEGLITTEENHARVATVDEVFKALKAKLELHQIQAMQDPASKMRGTLKDKKKLTKAFREESYDNLFFRLVADKYNEYVGMINSKADSLMGYATTIPKRIDELKIKLEIKDTLTDVILNKLNDYDGEYFHGEKGKIFARGLSLGTHLCKTHVGECYLDFYKTYEKQIELSGAYGVGIKHETWYMTDKIDMKNIGKKELAKIMVEAMDRDNITENGVIKAIEEILNG